MILPRQEVALVHEADAYARSTGKVGVCLVGNERTWRNESGDRTCYRLL